MKEKIEIPDKTKKQLLEELAELRAKVKLLEQEKKDVALTETQVVLQRQNTVMQALTRTLAETEMLNTVAMAATGEIELKGILTATLEQLKRLIPFTGGSIALAEGDQLIIQAAVGPFTKEALGQVLTRGKGRSWQVIETGQPFISNDVLASGVKPTTPLRSIVIVPLLWQDHIFGLLEIDSTEPNAFTPADQTLLQKVATALSNSVEFARRYAAEVQAVARTEAAQQRFVSLVNNLEAIVWEADPHSLEFKFVSQRAEDWLGYPVAEWIGNFGFWSKLIHPDDYERAINFYRSIANKPASYELEYRVVTVNQKVVWLRDSIYVVQASADAASQFRGLMVDITSRKQTEEELKTRVQQQEVIAALGKQALTNVPLSELLEYAVRVVAQTLEVEFSNILELLPGEKALLFRAGVGWKEGFIGQVQVEAGSGSMAGYVAQVRKSVVVEDWETETRFRRPALNAESHLLSSATVIIHSHASKPYGTLGVHSTQKRWFTRNDLNFLEAVGNVLAEAIERKRNEEVQHFLYEASSVFASSLDYDATLTRVARLSVPFLADMCIIDVLEENGSIERVAMTHTNLEKENLIYEHLHNYAPDPDGPHPIAQVLRSGQSQLYLDIADTTQMQVARDEKHLQVLRELNFKSTMVVPMIAHKRTLGAISFVTTESERRYNREDLILAEEIAWRAALAVDNARLYAQAQQSIQVQHELDLLKDRFLSIASHELRTPLTSIKGYTQLLERNLLKQQSQFAAAQSKPELERAIRVTNNINHQVNRMNDLISEMLDISRVQNDRLELNYTFNLDLVEVAQRVLEEQMVASNDHQLILEIQAEQLPLVGSCDEARLEQILNNLINNAVKYSPPGTTVTLGIYRSEQLATSTIGKTTAQATPDQEEIVFWVRDEGTGISEQQQVYIFEQFYRIRNENTSKVDGLGLGLYISHQLVKRHKGRMWVQSKPGQGSTFYFALPRYPNLEQVEA